MTRPCTSSPRGFILIAAMSGLAACAHHEPKIAVTSVVNSKYAALYQGEADERFPIPATEISAVPEQFLRTEVAYDTLEKPGTIIVDTTNRQLYFVLEGGRAIRYGIGVGADGMKWSGRATVGRKAAWPRWTPTASMIKRDPERNAPWANGMPPGLSNPLGPRALYLFQGGRDTLYRIHGTNEPHTIGEAVSSGCIRMLNQDIMDLYRRTAKDASVVVLADKSGPTIEARGALSPSAM